MTWSCDMPTNTRLLATILLASSAALVGCGGQAPAPPHDPGGVALVVGGRSNMPRPALTGQAREHVQEAFRSRDTVFIIGVSGTPKLLYTEKIKSRCDSERACDAAAKDYLHKVDALVAKVTADSPEADQLGAIATAADRLRALTGKGPRRIVVIDNGLQTVGDMPLQAPGALAVDPQEQAASVVQNKSLPSLAGIDVLLNSLGTGYAPQPDLGRPAQLRVEELWRAVLTKAGARVTIVPNELDESQAPTPNQPAVTPVVLDQRPVVGDGPCFRIREDQVGFQPGKDVFRDSAAAREVLAPIAEELKKQKLAISVIGTTALPEQPPFPLSTARAKRVAGVLSELGVHQNSMIIGGVGTGFSGFKPDTRLDGSLIPSLAMQNRLVIVNPVGRSC
jgi:outer membrane protein OmpA-like peptidoglycan-associated protein